MNNIMKILVSCDSYCYKYKDNYYLNNFGIILVNRYLMVFENVRFVVRTKEVSNEDELNKYNCLVDRSKVEIVPIPFFQGPKQYAKVYFKVKKMLNNIHVGCDFAIFRLPSTIAFAVWKSIRNKIPYATELVADAYDICNTNESLFQKILWKILNKEMIEACENALGISCVTRHYMQCHYISEISNSINSYYSSIEMLPSFRYKARAYPPKKCFEIILVSNQVYLNSRKGHKVAIESLKELREKEVNVKFIFVGDDYLNGIQEIKNYAKFLGVDKYIRFTGFLSTVQLKETLQKADILILPTKAEGLPRVVIEAMALGLPCVTTPVSGNPELIDDDFLVNYNDAKGFADKISKLINNKEIYETQSKINFERSREYCKDILDERRKQFFMKLRNRIK